MFLLRSTNRTLFFFAFFNQFRGFRIFSKNVQKDSVRCDQTLFRLRNARGWARHLAVQGMKIKKKIIFVLFSNNSIVFSPVKWAKRSRRPCWTATSTSTARTPTGIRRRLVKLSTSCSVRGRSRFGNFFIYLKGSYWIFFRKWILILADILFYQKK